MASCCYTEGQGSPSCVSSTGCLGFALEDNTENADPDAVALSKTRRRAALRRKAPTPKKANQRKNVPKSPATPVEAPKATPPKRRGVFARFKKKKNAIKDAAPMSPVERDALEKRFRELDEDGSGALSRAFAASFLGGRRPLSGWRWRPFAGAELASALSMTALTQSQIFDMVDEADVDGDGEIDLEEFLNMMQRLDRGGGADKSVWNVFKPKQKLSALELEGLKQKFREADTDGSGSLDPEELRAILRGTKFTDDQIEKLVKEALGSVISLEEFIALMEHSRGSSMNAALLVDFLIRKPDSDSLIWPGSPRDLARLRLEQEERDKREATWKVDQRKLIAERRKFIQKNQL